MHSAGITQLKSEKNVIYNSTFSSWQFNACNGTNCVGGRPLKCGLYDSRVRCQVSIIDVSIIAVYAAKSP
ncbi:hypothetical protein DPMN_101256 [Dreissena polymorpha]|uniref:Uncharacterized protein n=1 Tax=Dreissena polymorpha TaxID=45954 RepID=A0A9D4R8Y4_DREPO|nr:hypothetical protein DPMN_101256 [Dreissena polymorpha]